MTRLTAADVQQMQARVKGQAPPRAKSCGPNKLETRYGQYLTLRKHAGEIMDWRYEAIKLRLAPKTYFTPDFCVWYPDGALEFLEVKGFMRDDAAVKLKTAAVLFPYHRFVLVTWEHGKWNEKGVPNG